MIQLDQVQKSYLKDGQRTPVLEVGHFAVQAGERVALVGRSGSGKTTLLNLLSGLIRADFGTVRVDGRELSQMSEAQCDRFRAEAVGYMFQSFHLLDGFTALENVELGASFARRKANRQEARDLLEALELGHRMQHLPSELSIGQQARVALARALVGSPDLVLADEPTGALDEATAQTILDLLLSKAKERGVTLVVATHDTKVAAAFDRIVQVEELCCASNSDPAKGASL
jgi:putative ABC transport system ATP-binding protein